MGNNRPNHHKNHLINSLHQLKIEDLSNARIRSDKLKNTLVNKLLSAGISIRRKFIKKHLSEKQFNEISCY